MTGRTAAKRYYDRHIRPKRAAERRAKMDAWCRSVSHDDSCWAAGHFEGEGTISIQSAGRRFPMQFKPMVALASTDKDIISFFSDRWPTVICKPRKPTANSRLVYQWRLYGTLRVLRFLEDIYPHIRTSRVRVKAEIVMAFCERLQSCEYNREGDKSWKLPLVEAIRWLNRRGTSMPPYILTSDGRPLIERVQEAKLLPAPSDS